MKKLNKNELKTLKKVLLMLALFSWILGFGVGFSVGVSAEELPSIPTDVKTYTDYHCYNIDGSAQKYIQDNAVTDEYGIRMFDGYYCVALGSAYGEVGDIFIVELSTTMHLAVIMADEKSDNDTDKTNRYHPCPNYCGEDRACVVEFIVDEDKIPEDVSVYGSFDYCDLFHGNIKRITYVKHHEDPNISWE